MTPDDLHDALALVSVHWPKRSMSAHEVAAWRRTLRPLEFEGIVEALDSLACGNYSHFRPPVGVVVDCYRARARAKRLPTPPVVVEKLPLDSTRKYLDDVWEALGPVARHARSQAS